MRRRTPSSDRRAARTPAARCLTVRPRPALRPGALLLAASLSSAGCGSDAAASGWEGTVDTLETGRVVVQNAGPGAWEEGDGWRVEEVLRIGSLDSGGADMFGNVWSVELDDLGRSWVLDGQAQEIRVFGTDGTHVRTIGRRGGGPGEFSGAVRLDRAPDGRIWVMDPENGRVSVFDTAGTYVEGHTAPGGFMILPWPGGFDEEGRYTAPAPRFDGGFRLALARFDTGYTPLDTIVPPEDPVTRDQFTIERDGVTRVSAAVPFGGGHDWVYSPSGTFWALLRDEYQLDEITPAGDTLRTLRMAFEPVPVTSADIDEAVEDLEWFTEQGGRIDLSRLPDTKPPVSRFMIDERDHLWVAETTMVGEPDGRRWSIFDPDGRYLGDLALPFPLASAPAPRFRGGTLFGVVRDDLGVSYVVRARVDRPESAD